VLRIPVVLEDSALYPVAVLEFPVVFELSALYPTAVLLLSDPSSFSPAPEPRNTL